MALFLFSFLDEMANNGHNDCNEERYSSNNSNDHCNGFFVAKVERIRGRSGIRSTISICNNKEVQRQGSIC